MVVKSLRFPCHMFLLAFFYLTVPKINSIPNILNLLNNRNIIALIYSVTICVAWILTSDWRKFTGVLPYMGVWSLAVKQVCFGLLKWATCRHFVAKKTSYFLLVATNFFATDNNLNCCQTGLNVASKVMRLKGVDRLNTTPAVSWCIMSLTFRV